MRIIQILPGTGGSFYCENCVRDSALVKGMRTMGHDVIMVPLYLPLSIDEQGLAGGSPLFFGAVNLYLKQMFAPFRKAPGWIQTIFNSAPMLKFAAKRAGSTRAEGLEEMTLSMLRGEDGNQSGELDTLIQWLKTEGKPDVVHLANALLLGLARRIRQELNVPVVCSLQDEDFWLDGMNPAYLEETKSVLCDRAADVALFLPVSHYFKEKMMRFIDLPDNKFKVVPIGLDLSGYQQAALDFAPPVLGYLSRLNEVLGLDILADAFILLKRETRYKSVKLHITGGMTADDKSFVKKIRKKIESAGLADDVTFFPEFDRRHRIQFLRSLSMLTVPIPHGEAFGTFMIEALASGVPLVQPAMGAFPEFIKETGGGILYEPNDAVHLAEALRSLLDDQDHARKLAHQGREAVLNRYCLDCMTRHMLEIYQRVTQKNIG